MMLLIPKTMPRQPLGFSLIELMIIVAIVGIISIVAIPSYNNYVLKAGRADAKIALTELANLQEKHQSINAAYTSDFSKLNWTDTSSATAYSPDKKFTLNINLSASGAVYTIEADVVTSSSQAKDTKCTQFALNSYGVKTAEDKLGNDTSSSCW